MQRFVLGLTAVLLMAANPSGAASRPAVPFPHAAVVSVDALASQVGVDILRQGGNAADAAVATALALAVVYPEAGNLGGGQFTLWRAATGEVEVIDGRETASRKATAKMFLDADGKVRPGSSLFSPAAIAVPGSVAGLGMLHRRHGRLPWRATVAPALRLAASGFRLSRRLASDLRRRQARLAGDPAAAAVFYPSGHPPAEGDLLVQPDLAWSLRAIMEDGPGALGTGRLAARLASDLTARGALIDALDLAAYRPVLRQPLRAVYRGWEIFAPPPPSAGGVAVVQILGALSHYKFEPEDAGGSRIIHLTAETLKRAFADRQKWLADPGFVDIPIEHLLDSHYLQRWNDSILLEKATPAAQLFPPPGKAHPDPADADGQTTHFSVVDRWGQAVSQTTTLNAFFGSGLMAAGTGIFWNNEMDDFASAPGQPNLYLLPGAVPNAIAPGKRPLSSMSPIIVARHGKLAYVLGSPGGTTIPSTLVEVLINLIDLKMPPQAAVDAPRFHHQGQPDRLEFEVLPPEVRQALITRGYTLHRRAWSQGDVQLLAMAPDRSLMAVSDPRRGGEARGY